MVVLLSVLGVLVLCVGTTVVLGVSGALDPDEPAATKQAADVGKAAPLVGATSGRAATEGVTPSPAVSRTKAAAPTPTRTSARPARTSAQPKPTTKKPQPRPTTTKPKPRPTTTTKPPTKTVTPGAFCSPEGATGVSKTGKLYRCTRKAGEDRARWRKA